MRLLIKQRVFSWTDTYDVYDEWGAPKYFVKAEFFRLGHVIHVCDTAGNEVGSIEQKLLSLLPAFYLMIGGRELGCIRKEFSLFYPAYTLDCNGWTVEGNLLGWDYEVKSGLTPVMRISKEILHWGDTYTIDIFEPQNELLGLLIVIAIDAANCNK